MGDTVKIIIEIPKEAKEYFDKPESDDFKYSYYDHDGLIGKAIRNGTPLDDVKAEIVKAYDDVTMYSCDEQVSRFASIVCGIINRIGKAESEGE